MKKVLCVATIILLLCGILLGPLVSGGNFAYAEESTSYAITENGRIKYLLVNIVDGDYNIVGVRFSGYYFGASGIEVKADVYSDSLRFAIGSQSLTAEQLEARNKLVELFDRVHSYINEVDSLANTMYDGSALSNGSKLPISDVYRYNTASAGAKLQIDRHTYNMLAIAQEMYSATDGAFDPAVYRLVDLWGFSSRIYSNGNFGLNYDRPVSSQEFWSNGYPLPDVKYIKAFSDPSFTDFSPQAVELAQEGDGYYVTKHVEAAHVEGDGEAYEQWIDLGGIAKGYAVDGIKQMLSDSDLRFDSFNVDAGSSSMAYRGLSKLGVSDAFDPASALFPTALFSLQLQDSSVSTSGQNIRKYTVNGVEYAHILDCDTGEPAQTGVKSVTVVIPDDAGDYWAAKGDCLTTALTVMGRDRIVDFVNGYLKELGIKIAVQYQTLDGRKQLLTNYSKEELTGESDSFAEFGWALEVDSDGNFRYNSDAKFDTPTDTYKTVVIVLGCVLGVVVIGLVVYHFVRGRKTTAAKVQSARKDKPFKVGDILIYMGVVLVILVLFGVFVFDTGAVEDIQLVRVTDEQTGEILFTYNMQRDEYVVNANNSDGWTVEVTQNGNVTTVRLSRQIDGEEHFNELTITRGRAAEVKMTDSVCGFHQDCVRNFPAVTRPGGAIVCSPNRLKVVTQ